MEATKNFEKRIKYPAIHVKLSGNYGNAYFIIGAVIKALKDQGVSKDERSEFRDEATSGDYDHLLQTAMKWVNVS